MSLRWTVLFTIILNVVFSYFSNLLPQGKTMQEISHQYPTLFTPAPFTFSIWGLIYAVFIVYGIAQLLPSERGKWIYDHLAQPVLFIQAMGILWIMAFSYEFMTTALGISILMLIGGAIAFGRAKHAMINPAYSRLITVPFSIYLGWMSMAVIHQVAVYLVYQGFPFSAGETVNFTGLMIAAAFLLAVIISLTFRDWIFPLTIAWTFYGINEANNDFNEAIAELAMIGAVILVMWGLGYGLYRSARLRQYLHDYRPLHAHQSDGYHAPHH